MPLMCLIGRHKWNGCKCLACGKVRKAHDWTKDCGVCITCGERRHDAHDWSGCKCRTCGTVRQRALSENDHQWNDALTCTRCGARKQDIFLNELRGAHKTMLSYYVRGSTVEELQRNLLGDTALLLEMSGLAKISDASLRQPTVKSTAEAMRDYLGMRRDPQAELLQRFEDERLGLKKLFTQNCQGQAWLYINEVQRPGGLPFMIRADANLCLALLTHDCSTLDKAWKDYENAISLSPAESATMHCIHALEYISTIRKVKTASTAL